MATEQVGVQFRQLLCNRYQVLLYTSTVIKFETDGERDKLVTYSSPPFPGFP